MSVTPLAAWHEPQPADPTRIFKFKLEPESESTMMSVTGRAGGLPARLGLQFGSMSVSAGSESRLRLAHWLEQPTDRDPQIRRFSSSNSWAAGETGLLNLKLLVTTNFSLSGHLTHCGKCHFKICRARRQTLFQFLVRLNQPIPTRPHRATQANFKLNTNRGSTVTAA